MEARLDWDSLRERRVSRRRLLRRAGLAGAAIGGFGLAGCSPAAGPAPTPPPRSGAAVTATSGAAVAAPTRPAAPQPKYGGTIRFDHPTDPPHFDPHQTLQGGLYFGVGAMWGRLIRPDAGPGHAQGTLRPVGELAESWDQPDELTYIFKLRRGVRWQNIAPVNGREATAEDVVFSYERQLALKVADGFLGGITRAEAVDRYTLKLTLGKPDADFLATLASPNNVIVAREAVELKGDLKEGPFVGFGPWIVEKVEKNSATSLVRNPDYLERGKPYADRLEVVRLTDAATILAGFRAREFVRSGSGIGKEEIDRLKADNPELVTVRYKVTGSGTDFVMNASRPPFTDKRVRQAVAKALDRRQIIDTVFGGLGWLSAGIKLPALDWALPEDEMRRLYARDLPGARRLLAEAGLPNGFEVETLVLQLGDTYLNTAQLIQQQLREIGVTLNLKMMDALTYTERVFKGDHWTYCASISPIATTNLDLFQKHHSSGNRHATQLKDPKLDQMIEQQSVMVRDPEGRKRALQEIQRYLIDAAASTAVQTAETLTAHWPEVKDLTFDAYPTGENAPWLYVWFDK